MKIILGSSSPRRKMLLEIISDDFIQISPNIDETVKKNEDSINYVTRISLQKLNAIKKDFLNLIPNNNYIILTSDTVVSIDNNILGKPKNFDDAKTMLKKLSGKKHHVITAITLNFKKNNTSETITDFLKTEVVFKKLNDSTINKYLSSINYLDKAGSYAIQENGALIISKTIGSLSNIVGFPMRLLLKMLISKNLLSF